MSSYVATDPVPPRIILRFTLSQGGTLSIFMESLYSQLLPFRETRVPGLASETNIIVLIFEFNIDYS